jgi:hypothetical protein
MRLTRDLSNDETEMSLDSDQQHWLRTLGPLSEWVRAVTDHPDAFWEQQQAEIRKRIATPDRSPARVAAVGASAFAMVVLAILFLHIGPALPPPGAQSDPDQELLVAVEQAVQSGVPQALEPAAMLAEEISSSVQPTSTSPSRLQGEPK